MPRREWARGSLLPVFVGMAAIALSVGVFYFIFVDNPGDPAHTGTWIPPQQQILEDWTPPQQYQQTFEESMSMEASQDSIGFAVGGSQDVDNFRENIKNGFLPLYTDITYEGLFYDYYFDTGSQQRCEKLFCPSYSYAVSRDPFSDKTEYYLSVGLNSGIKESDFERKKLNLVLVLDVSGSMNSIFDRYYYDRYGLEQQPESRDDFTKTKLAVAGESIIGLLDHLTDEDRLGVVFFESGAHLAKPLESMGAADKKALRQSILEIDAEGGTNMASGIRMGTSLFDDVAGSDQSEYENRIIFLTDAMPNLGETEKDGLFGMIEQNAGQSIYTTVIGIGVDFNTELVDHIAKVRGANYYSVHSPSEFQERMVDEFEFMVTPLVFDLTLDMDATGYEIKNVYGSPEADQSTGQIMKVNTLFPSRVSDGQTRGGLVLLKLERLSDDGTITLTASYRDRAGQQDHDTVVVTFEDSEPDLYQNTGIQKGVLLARYAELMKWWIYDERSSHASGTAQTTSRLYEDGISTPDYVGSLGRWERQSVPLGVSDQYADAISQFSAYFQEEAALIDDPELLQEVSVMQRLAGL